MDTLVDRLLGRTLDWNGSPMSDEAPALHEVNCGLLREVAARIEMLEGALEPFAVAAGDIDERERGCSNMWEHPACMNVYVSDFRDARDTLAKASPEGGRALNELQRLGQDFDTGDPNA